MEVSFFMKLALIAGMALGYSLIFTLQVYVQLKKRFELTREDGIKLLWLNFFGLLLIGCFSLFVYRIYML